MPVFPLWLVAALSCVVISIVVPATLRAWDIGQMLANALDKTQTPRKAAAGYLGMTEPQLSRAIAGRGPEHLSADRLTRLPRRVWMALLVEIGEVYDLVPDADHRAVELARVAVRTARAELTHDSREEVVRASVA